VLSAFLPLNNHPKQMAKVACTAMANTDVLIIGAGIAGLTAGCYAQMSGLQSRIIERHHLPGGLCTAWERKGYVLEGCIHYLFGCGEGQPFNRLWQELQVTDHIQFIHHDELMRVIGADGQTLIVYTDPDQLEAHLKDISPEDSQLIESFVEGVRQFTDFDLSILQEKPRLLMNGNDWRAFAQAIVPFSIPMARWGMLTAAEFGAKFKHPFLQQAIPQMFGWSGIPMMAGMSVLAYMATGNAGFPAGGSLNFAQIIEQQYLALGGEVLYRSQVEKILVEDDTAVGVRLYNDDIHYANIIISAADGRATIFDMLDGAYTNRTIRRRYDSDLPIHTQLQVSYGISRPLPDAPHWAIYLLPEPTQIAGEDHTLLNVKSYGFDPSMSPQGHAVIVVAVESDYAYWHHIYGRRLYDTEQLQVGDVILDLLENLYPGISEDVVVEDVATPLSYERYTGNWHGATCGWLLTDKTMMMMVQGVEKTLPGLTNFYMCGQWVEPGGSIPIVAMSGRNVMQLVCHDLDKPFLVGENIVGG
jgi:phytoene dehydrogenase-like protein